MPQKPLTYPDSETSEMAVRLYSFESSKISGPGSCRRDIREVLWTRSEAIASIGIDEEEELVLDSLLESMGKQKQLMRIPNWDGEEDGFVSRNAETIRILGHCYEYWRRGRPGIEATRWEVVPKKIPDRDIPPEDFIEELISRLEEAVGRVRGSSLEQSCKDVVTGVCDVIAGEKTRFSRFQLDATLGGLLDALGRGKKGSILVAGVGSGKTLGFMLPPLILAKRDIIDGKADYGAHLFLYPRTALALDQFSKSLAPYAIAAGIPESQIHSEMGRHYRSSYPSVRKGIKAVHNGDIKPRLVVSTLETLKRRMAHPLIVKRLLRRVESVTMDEVHLISGMQGAQAAMLLRRLRRLCPSGSYWNGASATIAKPEEHLGRLIGEKSRDIRLVIPKAEDLAIDGVVHHVFIRPSGLISTAGALVNSTSLMIHSRRDDLSDRPRNRNQRRDTPKSIAFADNLEILGRWNSDFRENERTDEFDNGRRGSRRTHPLDEDTDNEESWNRQQREIPYALRFQNPLSRRISAEGGVLPDGGERALERVPDWLSEANGSGSEKPSICERCKSGERVALGHADEGLMGELAKLIHRSPHKRSDAFEPFLVDNPIFTSPSEIGTMDMCPYLQAGACTWFSSSDVGEVSRIGNASGSQRWDFSACATSRIQSSKSESNEEADDLADSVFEATFEELYSVRGAHGNDFVDLVMASPSLEVGVDLPNLTESILFKAIRNTASFRQKVGRVGRESFSDALNVILATDSPLDIHGYRQPRKLIDIGRLEPVPLKERNEAVALSTGYLAVWDWVCNACTIPEDLMSFSGEVATKVLKEAVLRIDEEQARVRSHVASVLSDDRYGPETPWIEEARKQVLDEIMLLLRPVSGYGFEPPIQGEANCISAIIHILGKGREGARAIPSGGVSELIRELDEEKSAVSKRRRDCGWLAEERLELLEKIDRVIDSSSSRVEDVEEIADEAYEISKDDSIDRAHRRSAKRLSRSMEEYGQRLDDLLETGVEIPSFRLVQQYQEMGSTEQSWRKYYLSDTMRFLEVFKNFRRDDWFVAPETLFIHPHSETVRLRSFPADAIRPDQADVPIDEALHSYLPGMWTMRLPQATFKVAATTTEPIGGGSVLRANLEEMERRGIRVRTIEGSLPAPPGRPEDRTIRVVTPQEITLLRRPNPRYTLAAHGSSRILDGDEGDPRGSQNRSIRIPRSFTNRWLNVELDEGVGIEPYLDLGEDESLVVTSQAGRVEKEVGAEHIKHPFQNTAFESVEWHEETAVVEYVYGLNRTISSDQGYGAELIYTDGYGADVAFGQRIRTEGVALRLHSEMVGKTVEMAIKGIEEGKSEWGPTILRALRSHLSEQAQGSGGALSSFDLDDVVAIIISRWNREGGAFSPVTISQISASLLEDMVDLGEIIRRRVDGKMGTLDEQGSLGDQDAQEREERVTRMMGVFTRTASVLSDGPEGFLGFLPLWIHRSILMSFGVTAVSALQRLSGADKGEVGYGLTEDSWGGRDSRVVIYDKAERGNGNVAVMRTFMHIPDIARKAQGTRGSLLPSVDYMTILEECLLPCQQHHSDLLALEYCRTGGEGSDLHRTMTDLKKEGREVYRVSGKTWEDLGVRGTKDAWKLPLMHLVRREMADLEGLARDDVTRATKICWNGCPECVDRIDVAQGGSAGMDFLDRALLDCWFRNSREATEDYHHISPSELAAGASALRIGSLHTLALSTPTQRLRSSLQPWTIGIDVPRGATEDGAEILIRESDIVGLRHPGESGMVVATPATGVKRLLWFDLLMTAYLDLSGSIPDERREVTMVYYDARDVSFDDVGVAPRMLEAIKEAAREDGIDSMESLSDVLIWLSRRGFRIRLCVDAGVISAERNDPVRDFLKRLRAADTDGNIELMERRVIDADQRRRNMHKKILVTPIYLLSGSANLTYSGTTSNEEIEAHITFGDPSYDEVRTSCEDTMARSNPINWDNL
jgi:hypothetical protein